MSERIYGVTPPISTALPTDEDKAQNEALHRELRVQGTFESPVETEKRKHVLAELEKITDAFVKRAAQEKEPKNTILIRDARGRVFTYGSYRLGVYGPGSDMDTLVVAPKYVTAEQYFRIFPELLVEMAPEGAITDLTPVPEAFVPIIKFEFSGISIDLIFCSIQTHRQLPSDKGWNLADNNLLRGLSETQVRSLNGTRVTDEILNLVPEPATFKLALRAIKLWAQRKAIYANIMGYPGGVAWAMLVARVCQLYPKATSATVVNKFFTIILKWPWPLPVLLKNIEYGSNVTTVPVWNPKIYHGDRNHRMPIITPSYPSMCATHNVGRSSMAVIQQELERAGKLTDEIMSGKRAWRDLFTKHTFFTSGFKYYLTVMAGARTKEGHNKWTGLIESKVRLLVNKIENHPSIALARPFNKGYDREHRFRTSEQYQEIQQGKLDYVYKPGEFGSEKPVKCEVKVEVKTENDAAGVKIKQEPDDAQGLPPPQQPSTAIKGENEDEAQVKLEDLPPHVDGSQDEEHEVYTTNFYIGLQLEEGAKSLDLSREVNDWKFMWLASDLYDPLTMFLTILHVKNTMLPDDVFEPGEQKPKPPVRKRKEVPDNAPNGTAKNGTGTVRNGNGGPPPAKRARPAAPVNTAAAVV